MGRQLVGKTVHIRRVRKGTNYYRILLLLAMILGGTWLLIGLRRGQVISPFDATPTPTRMSQSYFLEAQAYFDAGKLDDPSNALGGPGVPAINDAIDAYKAALEGDPGNARAWSELARIQAYSSSMLRNDTERLERLEEALASADEAISLAPDDSTVRAVRAFVLDWYAYNPLIPGERAQQLLIEAEREASRAYQVDPENALALAYYAEILNDQSKWTQAEKYASQAVEISPDQMDTHRVYAYVLESIGAYNKAIEEYLQAAQISPNMTFLYIRIGQNFREGIKNPDRALEYFERTARINEQLGIQNPIPYIEIAKTYTQQGQFFAAGINAKKALSLDPTNANTYGQLGMIFRRSRNYEGAMPLLKCAVRGCTAEENEMGKVAVGGLPLTNLTVAYYYVEYGTNLAFLSRPGENYCDEAFIVLEEVRAFRPDDVNLVGIVEDSQGICRRLENFSATASASTPGVVTATPEPVMSEMTPVP